MRFLSTVFGIAFIIAGSNANLQSGFFLTRIDHFRTQDQRTVPFVYHVNAEHYRNGPIYIYIKDAGDFSTKWIEEGLMVDIARETGAALLTADHRYFGENRPTETASFEDLQYLTIEQSLADIARLASLMSFETYRDPTKIVLWGSGFGATLAVWARKKYPHLIGSVWSSSGVFDITIATLGPYNWMDFLLFQTPGCRAIVQDAFREMERRIVANDATSLQDTLDLCHPIDTTDEQDIFSFFENHNNIFMNFIQEFSVVGANNLCRDLTAAPDLSPLDAFARWLNFVIRQGECFDHRYDGIVERASNTSWNQIGTDSGRRQFYYLRCTQFGLWLVADEFSWLPSISTDYQFKKCADIFGESYTREMILEANPRLTVNYGGVFQQFVSNVLYTAGFNDPWMFLGLVNIHDTTSDIILIDAAGKSADLRSISPLDNFDLVGAKQAIIRFVTNITQP